MTVNIVSLGNIIGSPIKELPKNYPQALILDPGFPADLASNLGFSTDNQLKPEDFAKFAYTIKQMSIWISNFLEHCGLLIVILSPYIKIMHKKHKDLEIGNYDWLDKKIREKHNLKFFENEKREIFLTDYGKYSPFANYLQSTKIIKNIYCTGNFNTLAVNSSGKALACFITQEKGRIVFLPKCYSRKDIRILNDSIKIALDKESWPSFEVIKEITPEWLTEYSFPESERLEEELLQKEAKIQQLEKQSTKLHDKLVWFDNLCNNLFCKDNREMGNALAIFIRQWGAKAYFNSIGIDIQFAAKYGFILPVVSNGGLQLWHGRKLLNMVQKNCKGIIVANAYRNIKPDKKPAAYCTKPLIDFAIKNNVSIISIWDIYKAHKEGNKRIIEKIFNNRGIMT